MNQPDPSVNPDSLAEHLILIGGYLRDPNIGSMVRDLRISRRRELLDVIVSDPQYASEIVGALAVNVAVEMLQRFVEASNGAAVDNHGIMDITPSHPTGAHIAGLALSRLIALPAATGQAEFTEAVVAVGHNPGVADVLIDLADTIVRLRNS